VQESPAIQQIDSGQIAQIQPRVNQADDSREVENEAPAVSPAIVKPDTIPDSPVVAETNKADNQGASSATGRPSFMSNIPAGSKPFFGQIASVDGSKITISSPMRNRNNATTGEAAIGSSASVSVTLTSGTTFTGGSKSDLANGTRVFGYGVANSDGSVVATNIQINPTMPGGGGLGRDKASMGN